MLYNLRHITKFVHSAPVTESLLEVRMEPLTEGRQRCLEFQLSVRPRANTFSSRDHQGNTVHHFDVAEAHARCC